MHQPFAAQQQPTAHHHYPHLTQAHFQFRTTVFCTHQFEQADLKFRDGRAIKSLAGEAPTFL
jgi:hypothetical protein